MTRNRKKAIGGGLPAIPNMTRSQKLALLAMDGKAGNGSVAAKFHAAIWGEVDPAVCGDYLKLQIARMQRGNMEDVEASLFGQAAALTAIFQGLAQRSSANMGENIEVAERYMRLALKAQSQCRTTLETLSEIKNPRSVAFVRQANIAGGHQQVNNGTRAGESESTQNELQEPTYVESVASRQTPQGIGVDSRPEAVAKVHRAKNARGKGAV